MLARNTTTIRSITRALEVLEALARTKFSTAADVATATALPRPTVYRILDTLIGAGYVQRVEDSDVFHLTGAVRNLARGFAIDAAATEIAASALKALSRHLVWPIDFSTYENGTMVIRHSTHRTSPRSLIAKANTGMRLPMVRTSPGLAYLGSLPRREIMSALAQSPNGERADRVLWRKLKTVRERGYASRQGGSLPKTSSIAIPVMWHDRPVGCICIMFIRSAVTIEKAAELYLAPLQEAASVIERSLMERSE